MHSVNLHNANINGAICIAIHSLLTVSGLLPNNSLNQQGVNLEALRGFDNAIYLLCCSKRGEQKR